MCNSNLNLKPKSCICVVHLTIIVYTLSVHIKFTFILLGYSRTLTFKPKWQIDGNANMEYC